ncbi:MAG: hypothetical protein OXF61_03645 [Acidimicrobiaceae bacterium]|nr:hypothetical protein [Acidimicrobiaceae bacterium]
MVEPDGPTVLLWMHCTRDDSQVEKARGYHAAQGKAAGNHYFRWKTAGFSGARGYEEYAELQEGRGPSTDHADEVLPTVHREM